MKYDDSQYQGAGALLYCADNGLAYDGPLNYCTYEGSRCGFDEACCGSFSCITGVCSYSGASVVGGANGEPGWAVSVCRAIYASSLPPGACSGPHPTGFVRRCHGPAVL